MPTKPNPLILTRVMVDPKWDTLRVAFNAELGKLDAAGQGKPGGFTLRAKEHQDANDSDHPAALIYWGPLPSVAQGRLRDMVKPYFNLSIMRNPEKRTHALATADEPHGY